MSLPSPTNKHIFNECLQTSRPSSAPDATKPRLYTISSKGLAPQLVTGLHHQVKDSNHKWESPSPIHWSGVNCWRSSYFGTSALFWYLYWRYAWMLLLPKMAHWSLLRRRRSISRRPLHFVIMSCISVRTTGRLCVHPWLNVWHRRRLRKYQRYPLRWLFCTPVLSNNDFWSHRQKQRRYFDNGNLASRSSV